MLLDVFKRGTLTHALALAIACYYNLLSDAHHFAIAIFLSLLYQWTFDLHIKCNKVANHLVPLSHAWKELSCFFLSYIIGVDKTCEVEEVTCPLSAVQTEPLMTVSH